MTAQEFLSAISQLIYLVLFAISIVRLVRLRTLVALDTFLFFGVIAVILLLGDADRPAGPLPTSRGSRWSAGWASPPCRSCCCAWRTTSSRARPG